MLEICVVGLGALGTIYAYALERSGRVNITAVCRSNYQVLKDRGVDIQSEKFGTIDSWKPSRTFQTVEEASDRKYDYVVCTTKFLPDVLPTSQVLKSLLNHTETIVLVQNGIGVEADLLQAAPAVTIISGCAWIDGTVVEGGRMVTHGVLDRLVLGVHQPLHEKSAGISVTSQERLNLFVGLLREGGADGRATDNIVAQRWRKNIWNIGYSVMCTLSRVTVATTLSDRWSAITVPAIRGLMEEEIAIARAVGITPSDLPDSAINDTMNESHLIHAETYAPRTQTPYTPPQFKPSMLVDLEAARPMEVDGIIGAVVRRARELGVPSPRLETAYTALLLLQEQLIQRYQIV